MFRERSPESWGKFLTLVVIMATVSQVLHAADKSKNAEESSADLPEVIQWQRDYGPTHEQRMKWWREARFGMFIHWGVYAVAGGVWNGTNVTKHGAEWIMNPARVPMAEYQKLPAKLNPTSFNAQAWVRLAKDAGMKYIVITAKHHDGFAMFHSKASAFNIYDATPFKRDPLAELADACRKEGIRLGFYYSQAQDWNHPGGAASGGHWDPAQEGSMDEFIDNVDVPQIRELLTGYGEVAVLWWDTPTGMNSERALKLLPLLKLQPGIISNNRLDKSKKTGDFETPEQKIPDTGLPGRDWETCMTINRTWGYRTYDHDWKSTETLIRNLVDIASKGGNYLLNVGPTGDGVIPGPSIERLKEIGKWMKVNSDAIYGTTASPFQRFAWGRCTKKVGKDSTTLYLHVFDWPSDGKLVVPGLQNDVTSAKLLAGGKKLTAKHSEDGLVLSVPSRAPDRISSTIELKLKGELLVAPPAHTANAAATK
jgi:alpha-L-fucosidase